MTRAFFVPAAVLAAGVLGCATSAAPDLAPQPVRGRVLYKGKPVAEASVRFHPLGGLPPAAVLTADTDADGEFAMSYKKAGDGAPAGQYAVTVVLREKRRDGDEEIRNGANLLPNKYADPETSGLIADVRPGDNELPDFALTD